MTDLFRHCPECGRRFHIKLVSKKMITSHSETGMTPPSLIVPRLGTSAGNPGVLPVQEGRPIVVYVEDFQYAFKCSHCGHEWFERRTEEHRES